MIKDIMKKFKRGKFFFWFRCLIFGFNKTKKKDMNKLEEINLQLKELTQAKTLLELIDKSNPEIKKLQLQINKLKEEQLSIKKNNQFKYHIKFTYSNIPVEFDYYSNLDVKIDTRKGTDYINEITKILFVEIISFLCEKYDGFFENLIIVRT